MGKVRTGHATSLDGFIAGPNDGPEAPMGEGGERLLAWYFGGDTPNTGCLFFFFFFFFLLILFSARAERPASHGATARRD